MSVQKPKSSKVRAGVIPYIVEDGEIKMMFMQTTLAPEAGWQIAQGIIDKNEPKRDGALREAAEDLGLFEPNCNSIRGIGSFGGITLYVAEVSDLTKFGDPLVEKIATVSWVSLAEFQESGRFSQKHIVKQAFAMISEFVEEKEK